MVSTLLNLKDKDLHQGLESEKERFYASKKITLTVDFLNFMIKVVKSLKI
jgi:hypothetical protein